MVTLEAMTLSLEEKMVMMVALEENVEAMKKMGDASNVKGFKLSQTHQPRTTREDKWRGYEWRGYVLEFGTNEARNFGIWEWHEIMKTKMKKDVRMDE